MRVLLWEKGAVLIQDEGKNQSRFQANDYWKIIDAAKAEGLELRDDAMHSPSPPTLHSSFKLRDYQEEALIAWEKTGYRGIIVLPTGSGKTVVALKAIEKTQSAALIVVPTLVLLDQWKKTLEEAFRVDVGSLGGGVNDIRALTVSTYESAVIHAGSIGNLFKLIIFDEVHHLPTPSNSQIAQCYLAPYRLGLTATLGNSPESLSALEEMVGPIIFRRHVEDLVGTHLSDYTIKTVQVPLLPTEKLEYDLRYSIYRSFLQSRGIKIRSAKDYLRFVQRSGFDPEARRALLARNTAMDLALNSEAKISYLRSLLRDNPNEKTILFTRHNKLVYKISRDLLIPAITHQTTPEERREILNRFRSGIYKKIITSQVLDEGIDVPDASMAVVLSGTGSNRQWIQRLGRILRKREGKQATLFELVSMETAETRMSSRRKQLD